MKKIIIKACLLAAAIASALLFAACGEENNSAQPTTVAQSQATAETQPTKFDLNKLHTFDTTSKDPFSGVWHITEGDGAKYTSFAYMFDGNKTAFLMMGNTAFMQPYEVSTDDDGNCILTAQLMFGINGTFVAEFNTSKDAVALTDNESQQITKIEKLDDYSILPEPDKNPVIDESILGAWTSDDGEYYYFDKSGIMYNNLYNNVYTYSAYSARDGKIKSTYSTGTEDEEAEYTYSLKDGKLIINGYEYKKISTSDLK